MLDRLRALGLDPNALPPLSQVSRSNKPELMKLLSESLGYRCTDCHVSDKDFRTPTPRRNVASKMWDEFVVARQLDRGPIFCDSCHQGSARILDRSRPHELKQFMREQFVERLSLKTPTDAAPHGCATCHGRPFRPQFLDEVWALPSNAGQR